MPTEYVDIKYADIKQADALHAALTASSYSSNATATLEDDVRTVQGKVNNATGGYGGMYFNSTYVVSSWLKGQHKGVFIVSMDVRNETEKEGSYIQIDVSTGTTAENVTDIPRRSKGDGWTHIAVLITQSSTSAWSIDLRCYGLAFNDTFKFSFKNFQLAEIGVSGIPRLDLAGVIMSAGAGLIREGSRLDINAANVSDAAAGSAGKVVTAGVLHMLARGNSLYKMGANMEVVDRTIQPKRASVGDIVAGTVHPDHIITNGALNGAINMGRAVDVTSEALTATLVPATGHDLRGEYVLTATSVASGDKVYYGFESTPDDHPFPKFADGLKYLFIVEVQNTSSFSLAGLGFSETSSPVDGLEMSLTDVSANSEYVRLACVTSTAYNSLTAWQTSGSAKTITLKIKNWRQYEVTALSDEAIATLAAMTDLDDAYSKYLIKTDAVCPWVSIINMGTSPAVTICAGLSYKLFATTGTHTLSVDTIVAGSYGRDAHISLYVNDVSSVQVQEPLILMDALQPNAINNCTVKFRNGEARLYVDDFDGGFAVSVADGTGSTSLYEGVTRTAESGMTEYITFARSLDGVAISLDTLDSSSTNWTKTISFIGNGKENTIIDLYNGQISITSAVSAYKVHFQNGSLNPDEDASVTFTDCIVDIDLTAVGMVTFIGDCEVNGTVYGHSFYVNDGCSIHGTGVFNLTGTYIYINRNNTLDGITINNGQGGGAYVFGYDEIVNATINRCKFNNCTDGTRGAAISYQETSGTITSCTISGCSCATAGVGGGIALTGNQTSVHNQVNHVNITGCYGGSKGGGVYVGSNYADFSDLTVSGCTAKFGGGLCLESGASATVTSGVFTSNTTGGTDTNVHLGGGVYVGSNCSAKLTSCTITDNGTAYQGGAMCVAGTSANANLSSCMISGNTCTYDTVAILNGGSMTLTSCTVTKNITSGVGAGVVTHLSNASATLNNCIITGNTTSADGGALAPCSASVITANSCLISGNKAISSGGAISMRYAGGKLFMTGTTVTDNNAPAGKGMHIAGSGCTATLADCTFTDNQDIVATGQAAVIVLDGTNRLDAAMTAATANVIVVSNGVLDLSRNSAMTPIAGSSLKVGSYSNGTFVQGGTATILTPDKINRVVSGAGTSIGSRGANNLIDVKRVVSGASISNFDEVYSASVPIEFEGLNFLVFSSGATGASVTGAPIHISSGAGLYVTGANQTETPGSVDHNTSGAFGGYEVYGTKINHLGYIEGATVSLHPGDSVNYKWRTGTTISSASASNTGTGNQNIVMSASALLMSVEEA